MFQNLIGWATILGGVATVLLLLLDLMDRLKKQPTPKNDDEP